MKQWILKDKISPETVSKFPEINPVVLQLLFDRGFKDQKAIDEFLYPDYSQDIHDPYLFSQMKKAVERIQLALINQEKVCIYGDYDADGICASSILAKVFKKIGLSFDIYIPHRESEGYGLNEKAVRFIQEQGSKLIVTVDCGISNLPEITLANQLGVDVIVTDHHHVPQNLPPAFAIIHPLVDDSYPFKFLAGGGVAFKFAQAILKHPDFGLSAPQVEVFEKWLLDLAAISTVADMVPLIGENRTLVKHGLIVLSKTKNIGLQKLIEVAAIQNRKMDAYTIAFQLAPRINAAGRMAHANDAYQLLTTDNIELAITIAYQLNKRNNERQQLSDKLYLEAKTQLGEVSDKTPILFAWGQGWPAGMVGLVASKLVNEYNRPAVVLGFDGEKYIASCRSIEEFNLIEGIEKVGNLLIRFGGHKGAAGFQVTPENFEPFKESFGSLGNEKLKGVKFLPKLFIDAEISLAEADWELVRLLNQFDPFGEANPKPKFLIRQTELKAIETVGQDEKHLRLIIGSVGLQRKVIAFGFAKNLQNLKINQKLDAVVELSINQWNGRQEIQLSLCDFRPSES